MLRCKLVQGDLGRVPVVNRAIITVHGHLQYLFDVPIRACNCKLVFGEGPRFVCADDGGGPKRFYRFTFLIKALFLAIRLLAIDNASVTVGSNPSGTFATMIPIANTKLYTGLLPIKKLTP